MNIDCDIKDIAGFLLKKDYQISQERKIVKEIWKNKTDIPLKYKNNLELFLRDIHYEISKLDMDMVEYDEIVQLYEEFDLLIDLDYNQTDDLDDFFKNIKLSLIYTQDKDFYQIKMRSLLKKLGYKKRTYKLNENIKKAIENQQLHTYNRRHIKCNISSLKLDDVLIIKLK